MKQIKIRKYFYFGLIFGLGLWFLILPRSVLAARLFLTSEWTEYSYGQTVILTVRLDTEGDCVNAVAGNLSFPAEILPGVIFNKTDSILLLWIGEPKVDQTAGKISFIGGIPGGYCGRLPGDAGQSDILGQIILRLPGTIIGDPVDQVTVDFLPSSKVLLNDGQGTAASLKLVGKTIKIVSQSQSTEVEKFPGVVGPEEVIHESEKLAPTTDLWREQLKADKIPPEDFKIQLGRSREIFDNQYFIVFFTTDKQVGVDYYEVQEGDGLWRRAVSPWRLTNQDLTQIIRVKAWDRAGNYRLAEYQPIIIWGGSFGYKIISVVVAVNLILIVIWYFFLKKKKKFEPLKGKR